MRSSSTAQIGSQTACFSGLVTPQGAAARQLAGQSMPESRICWLSGSHTAVESSWTQGKHHLSSVASRCHRLPAALQAVVRCSCCARALLKRLQAMRNLRSRTPAQIRADQELMRRARESPGVLELIGMVRVASGWTSVATEAVGRARLRVQGVFFKGHTEDSATQSPTASRC